MIACRLVDSVTARTVTAPAASGTARTMTRFEAPSEYSTRGTGRFSRRSISAIV